MEIKIAKKQKQMAMAMVQIGKKTRKDNPTIKD